MIRRNTKSERGTECDREREKAGPYRYSSTVKGGLDLAEVSPQHEPQVPHTRGRSVVRYMRLYAQSNECSSSDAGQGLLDGLMDQGCVVEGSDGQAPGNGYGQLQSLVRGCHVYIVFVNRLLIRALQQGGYVHKELEYVIQEVPPSHLITVFLDADSKRSFSPHLGSLATELMRTTSIDLYPGGGAHAICQGDSSGVDCSAALDAVNELLFLDKAPAARAQAARSRPNTTSSRLPQTLRP